MDWSRQALTRNESQKLSPPTSYLIFRKHTPSRFISQSFLTASEGVEEPVSGQDPELADPRWVVGSFRRVSASLGSAARPRET